VLVFFFFLNQVQSLEQCSESSASDKVKIEWGKRKTQSNYPHSFHIPEVVQSFLHFQRDFTIIQSNYNCSSTQARDFKYSSTQARDFLSSNTKARDF